MTTFKQPQLKVQYNWKTVRKVFFWTKMNTTRVNYLDSIIVKNGIKIKVYYDFPDEGKPYECEFRYPEEFEDMIENLDDGKLKTMNYKKM